MRNENILTEIVGDLKPLKDKNETEPENREPPRQWNTRTGPTPYALATLDGTIILVQNEIISWFVLFNSYFHMKYVVYSQVHSFESSVVCSGEIRCH